MQENSAAMPARRAGPQLMQSHSSGLHGIEETQLSQLDAHTAAAPSPGFQLYEDTQFISAPVAASGGLARRQRPLLPAANFPMINGMGTPGIAGGHEGHTAFLAENVRPPTPAAPASDTFDSPTKNKVCESWICIGPGQSVAPKSATTITEVIMQVQIASGLLMCHGCSSVRMPYTSDAVIF